ncbi:hypothetical protein PORY_002546 [Pneumocystis oryctolagi]|uniref:Uncharacterized protein n=1 Tax=Pneumocystis oryctolagi TaxID=42067 RepID=A0ACB7CAS5_9ASCO|nr:hypothetical protein PORY_002546 [Pneumocystis oryctolagi]
MQNLGRKNKIIQRTNDASIISKRSAEYFGYPFSKNQYLRAFVKKPKRRSPTINRGYYIRCKAIDTVIQNFLSEKNTVEKAIINLGCGYDPLPFRYISESTFNNVRFFDIDFPEIIENKKSIAEEDHELKKMLSKHILSSTNQLELQYQLIACDLRDLDSLKIILNEKCAALETMNILFISEVATIYMETEFSDKLIEWASFFPYANFVILEQILPSRDHPFGRTMVSYFNKLKAPLYSLNQYPTLSSQYNRFLNRGWNYIEAFDLCTFWYYGIEKEIKNKVDLAEDFDEWEEIILFLQHYCILIARKLPFKKYILLSSPPKGSQYLNSDESSPLLNNYIFNNSDLDSPLKEVGEIKKENLFRRKFGAATLFNQNSIVYHGGMSELGRDEKTFIITHKGNIVPELEIKSLGPRVFHTLDYFSQNNTLFCVGGRESPSKLSNSGSRSNHPTQNTIENISYSNRYRHGMVKVTLQNETRFIVFGGKRTYKIADEEWIIWSHENGWELLEVNSENKIQPRWGMCMIWLPEREEGIICGGMNKDGFICEDIWTFRISITNKKWVLDLIPWSDLSVLNIQHISRLGAKAVNVTGILDGNILIAGGVSMFQCISWEEQFVLLNLENRKITPLNIQIPVDTPMLIGFDMIRVDNNVIIFGGGCVCFSFGSYWNDNILVLFNSNLSKEWIIYEYKTTKINEQCYISKPDDCNINTSNPMIPKHMNFTIQNISNIKITCKDEWEEIMKKNIPTVLKGLNIGTCVKKWTPEYLISRIGNTREVIVHNAKTNFMNFHVKNFNYETMNFGEFINSVYSNESKLYMRSISTKNPRTKPSFLEEDFSEISDDFIIPPELSKSINPNKFSSPLRISSKDIGIWLHYDVMSNILVQIKGSKKVRLYSPSDILYLQFPHGSSSSKILNIFTEESVDLKNTHPYEVDLFPGDILYIPAFWLHSIYSLEPSISVNIFWRHLGNQHYATLTNDIYGNRDLKAYETGRNLIKKIIENFKGLTGDEKNFYLKRLGAELIEASKT